jgi:glycosyltransferase involved in cell wall biosynthesis
MKDVIAFVEYPPPFNGQSRNSKRIVEFLQQNNFKVNVVSYSSTVQINKRSINHYFLKTYCFIKAVLFWILKSKTLYMCCESRKGILFAILSSWISFLFKKKLVFHFRTREFINDKKTYFNFLKWDNASLHCIVLCESYKKNLHTMYKPKNIHVVSNLSIYPDFTELANNYGKNYVFFSNMIESKGVWNFIELAKLNPQKNFILAGKNSSKELNNKLLQISKNLSNLNYSPHITSLNEIIPLAKCLIFPSEYPIEVEPNVVYEFHLSGIPVIASSIGCLCDLKNLPGISICEGEGKVLLDNMNNEIKILKNYNLEENLNFYNSLKINSKNELLKIFKL